MDLKKPLSFEEQINRLKEHGMIIDNHDTAYDILSRINYYRFTGYTLQFRPEPNNSDLANNVHFDNVYKIYCFDETLRNICRKYLEVAEVYYKTQIAHVFSIKKCITPPHDQHYNEDNYFYKDGYNEVMEAFKKEKNYYKDSLIVKHHEEKYSSKMPLWVIFELMSFSNVSKLYNCMYYSEQESIANSVGTGYRVLENHLHCLSVLRNKCSHAARLYNTKFYPSARFSSVFYRRNPSVTNDTLFAYILVLARRLPDKESKNHFINEIKNVIDEYRNYIDLMLIGFPQNYFDILQNFINTSK